MRNTQTDTTPARTDAPRTLTVRLPLPWPLLTPNTRLHWAERARYTKQQREAGALYVRQAIVAATWPDLPIVARFAGRVRLDVTVYPRPRMQVHDDDNFWAALKATRDGLADAGLVADDRQFVVGALTWDKANRSGELVVTLVEVRDE